ncbi:MAG TPA: hypothetical protein VM938_02770 [Acidimicrobiales bacterium]|nr:hypothetical protein [Acidimicrobiales bacterium]
MLGVYVWQQTWRAWLRDRIVPDEAGEGVISAAIAVLVMAFLGVLMWQLFGDTLRKANSDVNTKLGDLN